MITYSLLNPTWPKAEVAADEARLQFREQGRLLSLELGVTLGNGASVNVAQAAQELHAFGSRPITVQICTTARSA